MSKLKPLVLLLPLLLWGCIVAPGKFSSTLTVLADRSFTFTYVGEVWAIDPSAAMAAAADDSDDSDDAEKRQAKADSSRARAAERERKNAAIAEALGREAGYRKVAYLGDGRFQIDYAITGKLTHNFVYPFNADAEIILPFIALELRGSDTVRVKAPAFAAADGSVGVAMSGMPSLGGREAVAGRLDGIFTLVTDAEIVSQNNEGGATAGADGRRTIVWKATPATKDAPLAVLKLAPL